MGASDDAPTRLQIQAQALIGIAMRAASLLGQPVSSPSKAVKGLLDKGVIDQEEALFLKKVIGLRNIVVHAYRPVELRIVDPILKSREQAL